MIEFNYTNKSKTVSLGKVAQLKQHRTHIEQQLKPKCFTFLRYITRPVWQDSAPVLKELGTTIMVMGGGVNQNYTTKFCLNNVSNLPCLGNYYYFLTYTSGLVLVN